MNDSTRFDRYTVTYLDIFGHRHESVHQERQSAAKTALQLLHDRQFGFPRSRNEEDTELTMHHKVYYSKNRLKQDMPYTNNVIYTVFLHEEDRLQEMANA